LDRNYNSSSKVDASIANPANIIAVGSAAVALCAAFIWPWTPVDEAVKAAAEEESKEEEGAVDERSESEEEEEEKSAVIEDVSKTKPAVDEEDDTAISEVEDELPSAKEIVGMAAAQSKSKITTKERMTAKKRVFFLFESQKQG